MFNTLLVQPLFNLLAAIYAVIPGHDFGVAVIVVTVLVRLLLWPLVNKQLHSQKAIQALAPEVAKIRAQAGGDRQKESKMLMELYKARNISPFSSIGLLIIQLPILFAFFVVLRDIVQPQYFAQFAYDPLKDLSVIKDVIANNSAFHPSLLGIVDLAKPNFWVGLVAGGAQFLQVRQLQPKTQSDAPGASAMKVTTYLFPLLTVYIGAIWASALALYWAVTSLVAILQQSLILRKDVEEIEEEAAETGIKITQRTQNQPTKSAKAKKRKRK